MDTTRGERPRRLLALRFSALGDVAMTIPAIYSVARAYPDLELYVATRPFFARMFIGAPSNVRVLTYDLKTAYKGLRGTLRLARELAALQPDYVADLHNMARTALLTSWLGLHGARTATVDKARASRRKVYAGGRPQRQYIQRYFDTFARLGLPARPDFSSVWPAHGPLPAPPLEVRHPAVGIAPFARYATKTYPPALMSEAARLLAAKGVNVYLFGGRGDEAATLDGWQQPGIVSVAGKYALEEELALMSRLDLMVSMDSANQHLAALAGTRVLTVWGGTTPACGFLGWGQTLAHTVSLGLACQPCSIAGSDDCPLGHMDCLRRLPPSVIADKVMSVIDR